MHKPQCCNNDKQADSLSIAVNHGMSVSVYDILPLYAYEQAGVQMQVGLEAGVAAAAAHRLDLPAAVCERAEQYPFVLPGQAVVPGRCGGQSDSEVP